MDCGTALAFLQCMRWILVPCGLLMAASTAGAQVRLDDFGFGAGYATFSSTAGSPQLTASATLSLANRPVELAAGTAVANSFVAANALWRFSRMTLGAGPALQSTNGDLLPGLSAIAAFAIPLAPTRAAALQLVARGGANVRATSFSLGLGMKLAPARGGMVFGEGTHIAKPAPERAGSWDALVAQIMLLDNSTTALQDVLATRTTLLMRFAAQDGSALTRDVGRVARILSGSSDTILLTISAPEPARIAAAATAGGFPPERISAAASGGGVTLQARRSVSASAIRSAQSSPRQ